VSNKKDKNSDKCQRITSVAKTKLGKRYVWGASGNKNTYDCSSFTKFVYKKIGITLPRTSINQSKFGKYVKRSELQKGDLIFFDTSKRRKGYVNHVGIYLGDNKFIHASSAKKKVVITSLNKDFYSNRYKVARRPS
jgi:cell wall-associated NlpC family hydrolase